MSALAQPKWPQHRTLPLKAAALHFALNKNHPYIDGNKRLALVATEVFLAINGGMLIATDGELEKLALGVAANDISRVENRAFFAGRCMRLTWDDETTRRWLRRHRLASGQTVDQAVERVRRSYHSLQAALQSVLQQVRRETSRTRSK